MVINLTVWPFMRLPGSHTLNARVGAEALSQQAAPVAQWKPAWFQTYPTLTHRQIGFLTTDFSPRVDPKSSIAESHKLLYSIKQFIHSAATQKQPELVPLRRDPEQRNTWGCYTLTVQLSVLPPDPSDPDLFLSVWSPGWATGPHIFCYAVVKISWLGLKISVPIFFVGPL